jgi:hypothetical protein
MERVWTAREDVLAYASGGLRRAPGSFFTAAVGLGLFQVALLLPRDRPAVTGLLALAGIGLTLGGVLGLLRSVERRGIWLDRESGQATTWRRVFVPVGSQRRDLGGFCTVLVSPGRVRTRFSSRAVYLVGLHGEVGEPLLLDEDSDYQAARRFAEEVAEFLGFSLTDASGTQAVIRAPGQADRLLSAVEPAVALAAPTPPPGLRPPGLRYRVSWRGPTLVIEEPPVRWRKLIGGPLLTFLVLGSACVGLGAYGRFAGAETLALTDPLRASAIAVGALFLVLVAVVLGSMPQLAQRRIVGAGPDGVRIKAQGPFATKDWAARAADITELRIALGHLSVVTPRDIRVVCGRLDYRLSRADLEWLRDQLTRALKGSPPAG